MYHLRVYKPGETIASAHLTVEVAADVLTSIPRLLAEHDGCERVEVLIGTTHLFSVDCSGNRLD